MRVRVLPVRLSARMLLLLRPLPLLQPLLLNRLLLLVLLGGVHARWQRWRTPDVRGLNTGGLGSCTWSRLACTQDWWWLLRLSRIGKRDA